MIEHSQTCRRFYGSPHTDNATARAQLGAVPQGFRDVVRRGGSVTLGYREYAPHPRLAASVQCYWSLQAAPSHLSQIANRGLSKGYVDLIFATGGAFCESAERWLGETRDLRCYLVGPMPQAAIAHSTRGVFAVGIRLRPGHAHALLGVPCGDLAEAPAVVRDVLPEVGAACLERVAEAPEATERLTLFEAHLLARAERRRGAHRGILAALREIERSHGNTTMDQLLELVDVGARQLERLFYAQVGVTPQRMCQILRVQRAIGLVRAAPGLSWASIAKQSGFYDQAHFIRQFKSVTGTTPVKYFAEPSLKLSET